ncbi:type I restriction endonuclease subunit R [Winogradskyella arenosi]|uniref:Type I restriction enzyme endonuclease subunit n=1 Tax=Winogradskyella arenosi TaxID=533325 RepID=A0A368ZFX3_9FLAO|nr:type I restriction endonuclease subunit R [Winogradskyella arenosi]RCW92416.1 type I restriction enzyme R subunit [Winogradskyella arenosi]
MAKITENDIELYAIEELENLGYSYIYGPDIAPDTDAQERTSFDQVILTERLQKAIDRINPSIPSNAKEDALKQVLRIGTPDLLTDNETFHKMLTEGINVTYQKDGSQRGDIVKLVDFDTVNNNEFNVINQFTVIEDNNNKRPDVILFINGLPLVVVELKNAVDENATIRSAYKQIQTYKATIPSLFTYNSILVISDGTEAKAGSLSAGFTRFMSWKTADGESEASHLIPEMETLINGMLNKETVLDLIRHFIVFEKSKKEDLKTGITTIETVKKIAAYHQYYAVNKAVKSTQLASVEDGDRKGGVVWHTQGSGKSLSMVFYSGKIVLNLNNPTILVITDRNDFDDQLFDTFASSTQLLRQKPVQAENRQHLKELLKVASGGVVFATVQKFQPEEGNIFETLSERKNIIVVADEAHRTQYGFKAKTIDEKDAEGNVVGNKVVYGFAKYMRDALPNATYLGFTGTPIENTDVNTSAVFGNYVDIYDIAQAVEDGATVRIFYESRLAKIALTEEGKKMVEDLDEELGEIELTETQKAKAKWTKLEALVGSQKRVKSIAKDVVTHFEARQEVFEGKAMVVSMSRRIAAELYKAITTLRPDWHSDDLDKGAVKVIMTASSSDGPEMAKHHTTKQQRRALADRMKDPKDELKLVIVRDMWLTGFDAPSMHTLYIDKPMKGHNLMQAIARVNRVYKDKPGGLVVDYLGIASDLKKALAFYSDSGGKGDPTIAQEQAVQLMLEKLEVVSQMFLEKPEQGYSDAYTNLVNDPAVPYLGKNKGLLYEEYFTADTKTKLKIILAAEEHILSIEDGKKRFINEVTALSKAFAIAIPHDQALDAKDEIGFFQAVKSRLQKFDTTGSGKSDDEIESAIRQVIDKALVSDGVIDVFDAAGIKKPDISILSDDFLMEIKDMEHKNLALETLKKLLNDEIKSRAKTNLIQSKSLMEMLENSIKKYQNKILTAAEVIEELIELANSIKNKDKADKDTGLTNEELAFYYAIAENESAKEVLGNDVLRELAVYLSEVVKNNATIDWTIKESVRAKLKVMVKRALRKFGYPPDLQKLATETVLKQAELLANHWTKESENQSTSS